MRLGTTDTLNTGTAPSDHFYFGNSEFYVTNVLSTYAKVVPSDGCTVAVQYDTKIPPRFGYHTGTTKITPGAGCGPGSCINFEYLDSKYNDAGNCRIQFSDRCAA